MSFIGVTLKLYRALVAGLALAHLLCRIVARMNTKIQASNATPALKTASTALVTSCESFCDLLQAHKEDLQDGIVGN